MSRIDSVRRAVACRAGSRTSKRPNLASKARARRRHAGNTAATLAARWGTARDRAMPMAMATRDRVVDAYGRMSTDYVPRAADIVGKAAKQATTASGPYRTEAAARGIAALAALRGQVTPADVRRIANRSRRQRIVMIALASGAAAAACGALMGRRRKDPSWVADTDDSASSDGGAPVRSLSERAGRRAHEAADRVKEAATRAGERVKSSEAAQRYADGTEVHDRAQSWP